MSRQLGEYLQEQQEPFILEVYLVERGCKKQRYIESLCSSSSTKLGLKGKKKDFLPNCYSKVVRNLFGRILTINSKKIFLNSGNKNGRVVGMSERESRKQKKQQSYVFVSDSCTETEEEEAFYYCKKKYDQFSPRFVDDYVVDENKVGVGWKFTWMDNTTGNTKQLSPASVLDETESYDCSPNDVEFKRIEQLMQKVSECKLDKRDEQKVDNNIDIDGSNTLFQFKQNKKTPQQAKHDLLFDCLLEVVDSRSPEELIGSEQLHQLMSELWSKVEAINESSINHVTNIDAFCSDKTLKNCEEQRQEIGMVVGDLILEDIYNEFFADMISGFFS